MLVKVALGKFLGIITNLLKVFGILSTEFVLIEF